MAKMSSLFIINVKRKFMKGWDLSVPTLFAVDIWMTSCEGYRCADGIIKDKLSNLPLDSVYINVISGAKTLYSDTTGKFDVCNSFGGCVPKCKDIMITFSKNGYKTITLQNPES